MRALVLAAALLTTATLATSACGQARGYAAGGGEARASVPGDSVRARADASRSKGADSAEITIIEISDFQCPYCGEFARTTYPRLDSAYIRTGRARMIYIHLPLGNHAQAFRAAEASMCAGAQGRFWEMHDRIFAAQREWSGAEDAVAQFEAMAGDLEIDLPAYRDCMINGRTASLVVSDAMQAAQAGIGGTPSFIINSPAGQRTLGGAVPFEQFASEIDALLAGQAPPAPGAPTQPSQPE
jgi:protein-disulfide isomerase